ncbi:HAD family hydrolase [Indioceanicola profundi]|uniref:HAD family hydrolase n=1 Tax=Indioceanicola profundi TaxID=2220096 RepID=UPI000E6AAD89|nr:HAD-IB family hydrolase [Indioceanicola profundi]
MTSADPRPGHDAPGLAIFDFDGTLVQGDSLLPFLELVAGRTRARTALLRAVRASVWDRAVRSGREDSRTAVKAGLLKRTLKGVPVEQARAAAKQLGAWIRWNPTILEALRRHADRGDRVVVATGALKLYMPDLLGDLPVDDLIATEMEIADGILTGRMCHGGNCVREEKARRITEYLERNGPFATTYGYGNRPSDLPFLALMEHPVVVKTARRGRTP